MHEDPFHYPEPIFALARRVVADVRAETDALLVCLWLLDLHGYPALRVPEPEIAAGTGIAMTSSLVDAHLHAMRLPVTPLGVRLRHERQTLAFLEIHLREGNPMSLGQPLTERLAPLAEALFASRSLAAVEAPRRGKILVVDDDDSIRRLLHTVLKHERFEVVEAPNGLLAQEVAATERPDLIVMDWQMPVMDGREATLRLKSNPKTVAIPILMLTSSAQLEDRLLALESGVQDFVCKPFDRRDLISRLEGQLRWRYLLAASPAPESAVAPRPAPISPKRDPRAGMDEATTQAEAFERRGEFEPAARAYQQAAECAVNPDVANKLQRLAGKMYLSWAEHATEASDIQRGYTAAARTFLAAGNLKLAKQSSDQAKVS